ncbi:hypothetical protein ACE38W_19005 [Chitinophaga sp. Hz27]|uniref:hypothetical protein n=1 Tax=Chitinophaga sp. Hz27 TaxID=3347169 RepID=UPI0035E0BA9B
MKRLHIYSLILLAATVYACKPYEKDITPESNAGIKLDFSVTQTPGYDNQVTFKSNTKGAIPYWDYVFGGTNQKDAVVVMPFAGDWYVKFFAYGAATPKYDSVKVTVSENDPYYFSSKYWELLTNGAAGKTWVWAMDAPDNSYYGVGPGDSPTPTWWVPSVTEFTGYGVINDEMTFDLNKGLNYRLLHAGTTTKANFSLDTLNLTLKISGADISYGEKVTYNILKLTNDELSLVQQGDGWRKYWHYKRKGFTF